MTANLDSMLSNPMTEPAIRAPARAEREAPPPGTILAAGILIGTALAYVGFVLPIAHERFLTDPFVGRLQFFLWASYLLEALLHAGMLGCGIALLFRRVRCVPWAIGLIVGNGLLYLVRATAFKGWDPVQDLGVLEVLVWLTLIPMVPLFWVWIVQRRRRSRSAVPMTSWRRWGLASEGALALFIIGANVYMAATFAREMMGSGEYEESALESDEIVDPGAGPAHPRDENGAPAQAPAYEEDVRADDETAQSGFAADDADETADEGVDSAARDDGALAATGGTARSSRTAAAAKGFLGPLESTEGKKRSPWEKGPSATLVSFWASWCGPCRHELPQLEELQRHLGSRGLKVVLVNVDLDSPDRVRQFLKRSGVHLPSLVDREQALFERLGGHALPTSFLLDDRGRPVKGYTGMADPARLSRDIYPLLRSSAPQPQQGS